MINNEPLAWLITGASSGIGRALTDQVLDDGAIVHAVFRDAGQAASFAERAPGRSFGLVADVRDAAAVDAAVAGATSGDRRLDVVVNAAGDAIVGAVEELSDAELLNQLDVNLLGVHRVVRAALPALRAAAGARPATIVNLSSVAGQVGYPGLGAYDASKAGLELLSEALAAEVAPLGIRVIIVEPGNIRTDWAGRSMSEAARRLDAYEQTAGASRSFFAELDGKQEGDPAVVAEAIREAVAEEDPPRRLVIGADARQWISDKLAAQTRELDRWRPSARE